MRNAQSTDWIHRMLAILAVGLLATAGCASMSDEESPGNCKASCEEITDFCIRTCQDKADTNLCEQGCIERGNTCKTKCG
jgi:hypothetical protein